MYNGGHINLDFNEPIKIIEIQIDVLTRIYFNRKRTTRFFKCKNKDKNQKKKMDRVVIPINQELFSSIAIPESDFGLDFFFFA